jgi:hypothetical protein
MFSRDERRKKLGLARARQEFAQRVKELRHKFTGSDPDVLVGSRERYHETLTQRHAAGVGSIEEKLDW